MTNVPNDRWAAGDAYEAYMGRWSRRVARAQEQSEKLLMLIHGQTARFGRKVSLHLKKVNAFPKH
jgi:hypothetical protein